MPQPASVVAMRSPAASMTLSVDELESCRERYAGEAFGVTSQQVMDAAHFMSAGVVSFARGLNDTPKIVAMLLVLQAFDIRWGFLAVAATMAIGGLLNARRIAETMSHKITAMNHGQGFSANLATGILVICASLFGLPVSTTHVSVGALFGMGVVTAQANPRVMLNIVLSWVITLPCAALLAGTVFTGFAMVLSLTSDNRFTQKLAEHSLPLRHTRTEVLQVNVGKLCNLTCVHCHVNAGPKRKEIMTRETIDRVIDWLAKTDIPTVDLTGGAPEMIPDFRYFVTPREEPRAARHVMDRCNLTILLEPGYEDYAQFLADHEVEIVASMPCYSPENVNAQRGEGVFDASIKALAAAEFTRLRQRGARCRCISSTTRTAPSFPARRRSSRPITSGAARAFRHRVQPPLHDHESPHLALRLLP